MSAAERIRSGAKKRLKVRISATGAPYSIWQYRTHYLSIALLIWGVLETASGIGIMVLSALGLFEISDVAPGVTLGVTTVLSGVLNAAVAISGIWGAYDPRKITLFFWAVFINALLNSWQSASLWSQGQMDPTTLMSLVIALAYAVCAWNVRGQTGYFDNHPHPEDSDAMG